MLTVHVLLSPNYFSMSVPPPPGISPDEMNLLRIICMMAWSDGELSADEQALMLEECAQLFADDPTERQQLRTELQDYLSQTVPLEELVPNLRNEDDRQLVLKLGYMVIQASRRSPQESAINREEQAAYRQLVELLALPNTVVEKIEWAADEELQHSESVVQALITGLRNFLR